MGPVTKVAAALAAVLTTTVLSGQAGQAVQAVQAVQAAPAEDGPYWLLNAHSGRCLTVQGASTAQSARVIQFTCAGGAPYNEEWFRKVHDDGTFLIVNRHSGKCLTVRGASTAAGAAVVQYTCNGTAPFNERWTSVSLPQEPSGSRLLIRNLHSGLCLTIQGAGTENNAFAIQHPCGGREAPHNEEWIQL